MIKFRKNGQVGFHMHKQAVKKAVVSILIFVIFFTICEPDVVTAAAKPSVIYANEPNPNIGIESGRGKLWVKGRNKKAKYTFTAKDKSIVRVQSYISKSGVPYAYCYGLKEGSTVVSVKQIYKGKTTVIGSQKFYVKPAVIGYKTIREPFVQLPISETYYKNHPLNLQDYNIIKYKNEKATYIYETKDSDILTLEKDGTGSFLS